MQTMQAMQAMKTMQAMKAMQAMQAMQAMKGIYNIQLFTQNGSFSDPYIFKFSNHPYDKYHCNRWPSECWKIHLI